MRPLLTLLLLCASPLACARDAGARQPAPEEFVSIVGRFAVLLPQKYAEYRPVFELEVAGQKFTGSAYRWQLAGGQQAVIGYADGPANAEAPARAEALLNAVRDAYAASAGGALAGEKRSAVGGRPGIIFVVQSPAGRVMAWASLLKNRLYLLTLTLNDAAVIEEQVKLMSSFRLVAPGELESRYRKLVDELAPPPLSQERAAGRPTSDAKDAGLKGKVKRLLTESEKYAGAELIGARSLVSDVVFDAQGDIVRIVNYAGGLPHTVRVYGYADGERAYRERRKAQEFVLLGVGRESKDMQAATPPPSLAKTVTRLFKIRYKFDNAGRAAEIRVVDEDGAEWEKNVYKPEERKYERTFYTLSFMMTKPIEGAKAKIVATLDDAGNPVEEALTTHDEPKRYVHRVGGEIYTGDTERFKTERFAHRYEFDAQGNWVKRVTSSLTKGKNGATVETPLSVTYRTITY